MSGGGLRIIGTRHGPEIAPQVHLRSHDRRRDRALPQHARATSRSAAARSASAAELPPLDGLNRHAARALQRNRQGQAS